MRLAPALLLLPLLLSPPLPARAIGPADRANPAFTPKDECQAKLHYLTAGVRAYNDLKGPAKPAGPATLDRLLAEEVLTVRPSCPNGGTYEVAVVGDKAVARCSVDGAFEAPLATGGIDPVRELARGCAESLRKIGDGLERLGLETKVDETTATTVAQLFGRGFFKSEPRCPAGGEYRILNEAGNLYGECSIHGNLKMIGELPPPGKPKPEPPKALAATPEGRAKICQANLETIVAAVEKITSDAVVDENTSFDLDRFVATEYLKTRLTCPDGEEYKITNQNHQISVICPRHGKRVLYY